MTNRTIARSRGDLLNSVATVRFALLPVLAGAAMALVGNTFTPSSASAAITCAVDPNGGVITQTTNTCTGSGAPESVTYTGFITNSTTNLNALTINGTTTHGVFIIANGTAQTITTTGAGSITVNSVTAATGDGIRLTSGGTGALSVGTAASRIGIAVTGGAGATTAQGIEVDGDGDASVFTGAVAITSTSTDGGSWAIRARSTPTILSGTGGAVIVNTQGTLLGQRGGILASTTGTDATDTVNVVTTGSVTGNAGTAIDARGVNGAVSVTASAPVVGGVGVGSAGGIDARVTGTGRVTVTTTGTGTVTGSGGVLGKGIGITTGSGGFALNVGANVTSTGSNAIQTTGTTGTNTIAINAGTVSAAGTGNPTATINMASSAGSLTILNVATGATITSTSATTALQNGDLALLGNGGRIAINNAGTIRGRIDFSGIGGLERNDFINTGTWHTSGTSSLGSFVGTFINNGVVNTYGTTTLNISPTAGTFNNNANGTLNGAAAAGASTTTLNSSFINNSGLITLVDNEANDVLLSPSGFYNGAGAGTIALDVALNAGGQTTCAAGPAVADCVRFFVVGGSTNITVNDVGTAGVGVLGDDILLVDAGFPATGAEFTLTGANVGITPQSGAAISKGFVQYELQFDPATNNFSLVSLPGGNMVEMASLPGAMQNIWHGSAEGWADRLAAVRQGLAANANSGLPVAAQAGLVNGLNFWGKAGYTDLTRASLQSGGGISFDTSYTQGTLGVQVGVDTVMSSGPGGAMMLGVLFGYNNSIQRFDADRTKATYRVFNIGGYASYVSNSGLSADILIKDDITRVDLNVAGVSGLKDVDGNSFGIKGTIGQRLPIGSNNDVYIEPLGSVAYVRSTLDSISDPGNTFDFADANSFRGTIGLRVGADTDGVGGYTYRPMVFLGVGHEFEGKNRVDITSGTSAFALRDKSIKTYGIASIGLSIFGQGGLSGFVKGDRMMGDNIEGWQIQAGLRMTN